MSLPICNSVVSRIPANPTGYRSKCVVITVIMLQLLFHTKCFSQVTHVNAGEHTILIEANARLNAENSRQIKNQTATNIALGTMNLEFNKIKKWQETYNKYLKTADEYASALKSASYIYADGVRILKTLSQLRKAIKNNPQGIAATVSMNNLYMETYTEMQTVYKLIKSGIMQGGSKNMLTGKERSETLWELQDRLNSFSHKLQSLYRSIRHYRLSDVWNRATAGMIKRDKSDLLEQSLESWSRTAQEVSIYGD